MKVRLQSAVRGTINEVWDNFDEQLFRYLLPPGTRLIKFDGSDPGDIVHLKFPFKQEWISKITEVHRQDDHCFFVDKGIKLPGPLKFWKHKHHVYHINKYKTLIVDDMEYSTGSELLDLLIYPFLYLAFLPRTSLYRKYFQSMTNTEQLSTQ